MNNILDCSQSDLKALMQAWGEPAYRATQLGQWIHQRKVTDFDAMTNFPRALRTRLKSHVSMGLPTIRQEQIAPDGTCKWLLALNDGNEIETVYIPEKTRGTLCLSSQVGCALQCHFCATGKAGFNRNLSLSEVLGQLWLATQRYAITNVVMMGMGEPLLNYEVLVPALEWMLCDTAYGLSKHRVTVSTSGVIPGMLALKEASPVCLAVSLHAPNNALRTQLVPLNKKYSLEQLIPVCRDYFPAASRRKIMFEYVMLDAVNDSQREAEELIQLLKGVACKVNLIPFNPFPGTSYRPSPESALTSFRMHLVKAGLNTHIRRPRGDAIDAACGQLAGRFYDRTGRYARWLKNIDIQWRQM